MPDDVGGKPFQDGWEPDDDRGGADEDFAPVVFDEDFVRAAEIHEPTAVERLLAAAQARAEAEASRARAGHVPPDDDLYDDGYGSGYGSREGGHDGAYGPLDGDDAYDDDAGPYGRHGGALRPYRGQARWYRPVAWMLALLMGIGMVALAFSAVYRGASQGRDEQVPLPATSDNSRPGGPVGPSAPVEYTPPAASAVPRTAP
ncbi:SCO2584 family spore wall biosynthesis protein [Streptomyces sp. NPDC054887]